MKKLSIILPVILGLICCSSVFKTLRIYKKYKHKKKEYTEKIDKKEWELLENYSDVGNKQIPSIKDLGNKNLDLTNVDCSNKDLSGYNPQRISFNDDTVFPKNVSKLPSNFDKNKILEVHKNPGLNISKLHKRGIDGTGISMAIIGSTLSPHQEYNSNLVLYEEFLNDKVTEYLLKYLDGIPGTMSGSAVSSIAVGDTVGVAPKARLYYFAADIYDHIPSNDENVTEYRTSKYYAQALKRILEKNKRLSDKSKIVVVSTVEDPSLTKDSKLWSDIVEQAKKEGVFVTTVNIINEYGLIDGSVDRDVFLDPDDSNSYSQIYSQEDQNPSVDTQKKTLCFPMNHRTTASSDGNDHYIHYAEGKLSWMKAYEAGIYVLAKSVNPKITPQEFFRIGLKTGTYSEKTKCVLINPVAFIEEIKK